MDGDQDTNKENNMTEIPTADTKSRPFGGMALANAVAPVGEDTPAEWTRQRAEAAAMTAPKRSNADIAQEQAALEAHLRGTNGKTTPPDSSSPVALEPAVIQPDSRPYAPPTPVVSSSRRAGNSGFWVKMLGLFGIASAVATPAVINHEAIGAAWNESQLTEDQKAAQAKYQLYLEQSPNQIIHNLKVSGEDGALLRTRPYSLNPENLKDASFDLTGQKLQKGDVVSDAIAIEGQDPQNPTKVDKHSTWYFIPDPDGNNGVFVWSGNLVEIAQDNSPKSAAKN